ncbi:MAG: hypothetical protein ABW187_11060 [Dokdonella sp.]
MKSEKHLAMAGVADADKAHIATLLRKAGACLQDDWHIATDAAVDLVIVDLEHFGGRVARVRALDERKPFIVLADAQADSLGAQWVLRRPVDANELAEALNRSIVEPAERLDLPYGGALLGRAAPIALVAQQETATETAADDDGRATFDPARRARIVTDIDKLIARGRGALLIERAGLPALVLDPHSDSYLSTADLSELEPYLRDPVKGRECRPISGVRFADFRDTTPAHPLARLRWLAGLLGSNGWLAPHLDPGGSYKVKSWISVDGSYRRQYRIAMNMLRSKPLHRIAAAAGATMTEVFDVVNAYDAIDLLEWTPRRSRYAAPDAANEELPGPRHGQEPAGATKKLKRLLAASVFPR